MPLAKLQMVRSVLLDAVMTQRAVLDYYFANFLRDTMGPELCRVFANYPAQNDLIAECIELLIRLFVEDLKSQIYHVNFIKGISRLLKHDCVLYGK